MRHIWLPSQHADLHVWNDTSKTWQSYSSWQKVADDFGKSPVCLYFPSRHSLQIKTELSNAELKQLGETGKQYLFEEISLSSVEKLQVREVESSGHHYLYATAKNDLEQWQQSALLADMEIQALVPDFLLLPTPDVGGSVFLYHDEHTTLVRQSESYGMAVSFLPLISEQLELVDELLLVKSVNSQGDEENESHIVDELDELDIVYSPTNQIIEPISNPNRHALNFLIKSSKNSQLSPYLKVALFVGVLALLTQLIADGLGSYYYEKAVKDTQRASTKQFKSWFPDERLNGRTSIERQIKPMLISGNQADSGTMDVFNRVSPLIKQSRLLATELLIDKKNISLKLQANDRRDLDGFIRKLQQQGISAQLGSVHSTKPSNGSSDMNSRSLITGSITITASQPEI